MVMTKPLSLSQLAPAPINNAQPDFVRPLPVGVDPAKVNPNLPYGVDPRIIGPNGNSIYAAAYNKFKPQGLGRWQDPRKVAPANPWANYGYTPPGYIQPPSSSMMPSGEGDTPLVNAAMNTQRAPVATPSRAPSVELISIPKRELNDEGPLRPPIPPVSAPGQMSEDPIRNLARANVRRR